MFPTCDCICAPGSACWCFKGEVYPSDQVSCHLVWWLHCSMLQPLSLGRHVDSIMKSADFLHARMESKQPLLCEQLLGMRLHSNCTKWKKKTAQLFLGELFTQCARLLPQNCCCHSRRCHCPWESECVLVFLTCLRANVPFMCQNWQKCRTWDGNNCHCWHLH